jgi:hypothetical protein
LFRRSQIEVSWHRTRGTGASSERVLVRRNGGPEEQFGSLDELPPDVRQMIEGFLGHPSLLPGETPVTAELISESGAPIPRASRTRHVGRAVALIGDASTIEVGRTEPSRGARSVQIPVPLQQPDGIEVWRAGGTMQLRYRWFGVLPVIGGVLGATVFAWPIVFEGWISSPWAWISFAAAILIAYWGAAFLFNRTDFEICDRQLTVRHGPLPWPGKRSLRRETVNQLFCQAFRSRYGVSYRLNAVTADGRLIPLKNDIADRDQALYLEREIESALGISDLAVAGEMR